MKNGTRLLGQTVKYQKAQKAELNSISLKINTKVKNQIVFNYKYEIGPTEKFISIKDYKIRKNKE